MPAAQFKLMSRVNIVKLSHHDTLISAARYEAPMAPNMDIFQETAMEAFPMAIVGFAIAFSVAKVYSVKHDYTIDGNQVRNRVNIYLKEKPLHGIK